MNPGISSLQGPHQVAQKSSTITLPLYAASLTGLLSRSFSVKFRFAALPLASHAATPAGADFFVAPVHGRGTYRVSSASASAAEAAIAHRIFIQKLPQAARRPACAYCSLAKRRLNEGRHPFDLASRFARNQDEGAAAGRPDDRLVPHHLDDLIWARRLRQHEHRHGMAVVAVHDVRDAAFAIEARPLAHELEAPAVGPLGQAETQAEARGDRTLDNRRGVVRAEHPIRAETLDVIRGELGGHHARRSIRERIHERAADDEDEGGSEGVGGDTRAP